MGIHFYYMCGIAGVYYPDGRLPDEDQLRRMSDAIAHRGPDGEGQWRAPGIGLAHRRLAIIELTNAGAQPMTDASGRYHVVFNGEVYNFASLRAELTALGHVFRSSSDTEVVIEAFQEWQEKSFSKFRGMFALALWDQQERRLILARDRIGKKPLYILRQPDGSLAFASEVKAFKMLGSVNVDWNAIRLFLGLQYVPSPLTGFLGIEQLLPGTYAVVDAHGWRSQGYVPSLTEAEDMPLRIEDATERVRALIDESVRLRMIAADVPVGAFLSGGIDSAAMVAFASKYTDRPLQTFTMGFPSIDMDERQDARLIAETFHTDHSEFMAQPEDMLRLVDDLVRLYDLPYADSSALPLWLLAKETANEIKVVLTGDGGDEVFGGYRRYGVYERLLQIAAVPGLSTVSPLSRPVTALLAKVMRDPRWTRLADSLSALRQHPERMYGEVFCGSYFNTRQLHQTFDPAYLQATEAFDAVSFVTQEMRGAVGLDAAMRFDLQSYLPDDLNVKMDRATMRFGLEARSPLLDQELVAYMSALPDAWKVSQGRKKILFKRALNGIVPNEVLKRRKRGFQVPLAQWFRTNLKGLLEERLLQTSSLHEIVSRKALEDLIQENARGYDHGNRLWMLVTLSTWLRGLHTS